MKLIHSIKVEINLIQSTDGNNNNNDDDDNDNYRINKFIKRRTCHLMDLAVPLSKKKRKQKDRQKLGSC